MNESIKKNIVLDKSNKKSAEMRSGALLRNFSKNHPLFFLISMALLVNFTIALFALKLPDVGDQTAFRHWAIFFADEPIHKAYSTTETNYDWLPLYIYVSKIVGLTYRYSGLYDHYGPESKALTLLLNAAMIMLNLMIGLMIFKLVSSLYGEGGKPSLAASIYLFNPAIILATGVFGYQDAMHMGLVLLSVFLLHKNRNHLAAVCMALGFLTKPQAAIFLPVIAIYILILKGLRGLFSSAAIAVLVSIFALFPFIVSGEIVGVFKMYLNVTSVHKWLTGLAHNFWWAFCWFFWHSWHYSDREPLFRWLNVNGLTVGLSLLVTISAGIFFKFFRKPTFPMLIHCCAFIGFIFFMVTTEMHENYLYGVFPFLAIMATASRFHWIIFIGLTITFSLNLVLANWYLLTHMPLMLGPIQISVINAFVNLLILGCWGYFFFIRELLMLKRKDIA